MYEGRHTQEFSPHMFVTLGAGPVRSQQVLNNLHGYEGPSTAGAAITHYVTALASSHGISLQTYLKIQCNFPQGGQVISL